MASCRTGADRGHRGLAVIQSLFIGQLHCILTRRPYIGAHEFNKRSKTKELKPVSEVVGDHQPAQGELFLISYQNALVECGRTFALCQMVARPSRPRAGWPGIGSRPRTRGTERPPCAPAASAPAKARSPPNTPPRSWWGASWGCGCRRWKKREQRPRGQGFAWAHLPSGQNHREGALPSLFPRQPGAVDRSGAILGGLHGCTAKSVHGCGNGPIGRSCGVTVMLGFES